MDNSNLAVWEKIFKTREWGKYPPIALVRFIAKNFYKADKRESIKILEIGSGTGTNLWYCAREGFRVYGIDGSSTATQKMLQRFEDEHLSEKLLGYKVGDYFERLDDLENESFDAVIDVESLCCNPFNKTQKIIQKAFKKLKPGGKFFSITFADGTYGLEGEEIDYHAVYPNKGPMAGEGFNRYTTREDIEKLYKLQNNSINSIQREELHIDEDKVIKEWIVELTKH